MNEKNTSIFRFRNCDSSTGRVALFLPHTQQKHPSLYVLYSPPCMWRISSGTQKHACSDACSILDSKLPVSVCENQFPVFTLWVMEIDISRLCSSVGYSTRWLKCWMDGSKTRNCRKQRQQTAVAYLLAQEEKQSNNLNALHFFAKPLLVNILLRSYIYRIY